MRPGYRLSQAVSYMTSGRQTAPPLPSDAAARLTEPMLQQFRLLPPRDQRHLLRVYRYLLAHGADADTVTAGLIHDVGKACRACRINLLDRTLHVLLRSLVPGPYGSFARIGKPPRPVAGLHLLANHACRGARAAELAGYNPRVCELIRDHETGGAPHDAQLRLLRMADETADRTRDTTNR